MGNKASLSRQYAKRGAVMILVLGVLVVLALLATTFARLQTVEHEVARNFTDDVRAKLFAQSGIEDTLPRLASLNTSPEPKFQGYDINEDGTISGAELDSGQLPTDKPGVETAKNPSYAVELDNDPTAGLPDSRTVKCEMPTATGMQPIRWGFSGVVGTKINDTGSAIGTPGGYTSFTGTYVRNGDLYSVRVADTAGCVYVNDGVYLYGSENSPKNLAQPSGGNRSSVSEALLNTLDNLGWACGVPTGTQVGLQILNNRPPKGYVNKYEIESYVGTVNFNKIKDNITVNAWVDKNVVNPVPMSATMLPQYKVSYWRGGANPTYRHGGCGNNCRGVNYSNNSAMLALQPLSYVGGIAQTPAVNPADTSVFGVDELAPQYIEVAWRAPVNVNSASLQTLEALIADIQGTFLLEKRSNTPAGNAPQGFTFNGAGYGGSFITVTPQAPQLTTSVGTTWLYEMHSYDRNKPNTATMYGTSYGGGTVWGAINSSTPPDMDELGWLYATCPYKGTWSGTGSGIISAKAIAQHISCCRKAKPNSGPPTSDDGLYAPAAGGPFDYSIKSFGGPFKTWGQFYEFIDNLVANGGPIPGPNGGIYDSRLSLFNDFNDTTGTWAWTSLTNVPRIASQAAGDALKANFNPNCHLNEINPDKNMYLHVDKTDLVRNSTEFCFRPTGYFEIESLGRVLRPKDGAADAFTSTNNEIRAEKKVVVSVKMFDLYRETSQRHFYGPPSTTANTSCIASRDGVQPETNNNLSLEIGSEPDNSGGLVYSDLWGGPSMPTPTPAIDDYAGPQMASTGWGYEHEGYLRLATLGGPTTAAPPPVPFAIASGGAAPVPFYGVKSGKPALSLTPTGVVRTGAMLGRDACMRGHFAFDDMLNYSQSAFDLSMPWMRENIAANNQNRTSGSSTDTGTKPPQFPLANENKVEHFRNWPDYGYISSGAVAPDDSPYMPDRLGNATPYARLARSFRLPLVAGTGTSTSTFFNAPVLPPYPMLDFRMDGLYSERGSAPAYWIDHGRSWDNYTGMVTAWIKPNWYPEHSGKARKFFSMSRYHLKNAGYKNPQGMDMHYMPAHNYQWGMPAVPNTELGYGTPPYLLTPNTYPGGAGNDAPEDAQQWGGGIGRGPKFFHPMSLTTDAWMDCFSGSLDDMNHEGPWLEFHFRQVTETLNHNDHVHNNAADMYAGKQTVPNQLEAHRWSHLAFQWYFYIQSTAYSNNHASRMWVNYMPYGKNPGNFTANTNTFGSASGLWMDACWSDSNRAERPYYYVTGNPPESLSTRYANAVRLGEVSQHLDYLICSADQPNAPTPRFPRNFTADCTFDEFYAYRGAVSGGLPVLSPATASTPSDLAIYSTTGSYSPADTLVRETFYQGRYYRPTPGGPVDSFFISPWLSLSALGSNRALPPPTTVSPPVSTGGGGGGGGGTVSSAPPSMASKRLLGVSWTWHPEGWSNYMAVDPTSGTPPQSFGRMVPYALNWSKLQGTSSVLPSNPLAKVPPSSIAPTVVAPLSDSDVLYQLDPNSPGQGIPMCRVFIDHKSAAGVITQYPLGAPLALSGYVDDAYSQIVTAAGGPLTLATGDQFRYKVWFQINGVNTSLTAPTVLLVSPYFDDITFQYDNGQPEYLSWSLQTL